MSAQSYIRRFSEIRLSDGGVSPPAPGHLPADDADGHAGAPHHGWAIPE
jgi:hypothetical protein